MDNLLKPRIRFKGFTDVWEQRKLGDVAFIVGGGTPSTEIPEYWNGDINWYSPAEIGDQIYVSESQRKITKLGLEKSSAKILPIGTVLFTSRAGIGNSAILKEKGCTNQGFQSIIPINNLLNSYFIFSRKNELKKYAETVGAGSTFVEVSGKQMSEMELLIPKMEEQNKIGQFFSNIDNLITLHQRKCDKLVELKKSLLEKMFPKNSSNIPEIRFKGFTDVWEQRKFEKIFNYERPDKYIVESTEYLEFGPTPVLTANKAFILGYTNEKNLYLNSKNSIIFDDFTLDAKFVDFPYMVKSSAIKILTVKDEKTDNLRFNYYLLSQHKFNMLGHARHYISVVQPEEVYTTNKVEQNKIGELFTNIDNLITLHQRKQQKLINLKQSLLNDMFI